MATAFGGWWPQSAQWTTRSTMKNRGPIEKYFHGVLRVSFVFIVALKIYKEQHFLLTGEPLFRESSFTFEWGH
jgi:hypothetical protein